MCEHVDEQSMRLMVSKQVSLTGSTGAGPKSEHDQPQWRRSRSQSSSQCHCERKKPQRCEQAFWQHAGSEGVLKAETHRRTTRSRWRRRRDVCMRETPSYGTRCRRRTSKRSSSHTTVVPVTIRQIQRKQTTRKIGKVYTTEDGQAYPGSGRREARRRSATPGASSK